jgi:hypothetical protein
MAADATTSWFPLFEFQEWNYESTLVIPTPAEIDGKAGSPVTARKWARGALALGQAFTTAEGYTVGGDLSFAPGFGLVVSARGALGSGSAPASFNATGTGMEGATKGAIYELVGWVFPEEPIVNQAARVLSIRGSVRAVRGPDPSPGTDLGKMPVGTVGAFVITRKIQSV